MPLLFQTHIILMAYREALRQLYIARLTVGEERKKGRKAGLVHDPSRRGNHTDDHQILRSPTNLKTGQAHLHTETSLPSPAGQSNGYT